MPSLVTEPGIIHYETYGRGRPVLLLHGWLGSWSLWRDTIEALGRDFRTYALDFFGFGESGMMADHLTRRTSAYTVPIYVEMVHQFMDRMGIVKAPLIGHSMGGTVSLSMAINHPDKVVKVGVIGSPIDGNSLNLLLKLSGNPKMAAFFWLFHGRGLRVFLQGYSYFMARNGRSMARMINKDVSMISMESFFQSIGTLRQTDLRPDLHTIQVPTLGMYGKRDIIVRPSENETLKAGVPHAQIEWFPDAGHFIMRDSPERFIGTLRTFLLADGS
ncbi:alpha/beta fold hydrolase [Aggregatilinea lenta]|uniref:alpha/beta fold hydrolase n=1 Tax=Aggregatilinea lenta TaxID=913108 RepID=UPI0013C35135|nr:alpha/beta hydrolase [Aggregatilinea lenta]